MNKCCCVKVTFWWIEKNSEFRMGYFLEGLIIIFDLNYACC